MEGMRPLRIGIAGIAVAIQLCVATGSAAAQDAEAPRFVRRWSIRLQENDQRLLAGDWKEAKDEARQLLQRIAYHPRGRMLQPIGAGAYQYALALAALDRAEEARWYSGVAWAFHPTIPVDQLQAKYGDVGRQVADWFREAAVQPEADDCTAQEAEKAFTRPKQLTGRRPTYPEALLRQGGLGAAMISILIDERGVPHGPQIVAAQTTHLGLAWGFLDSLSSARYEPARRHDEPVACRLTLATNISLASEGIWLRVKGGESAERGKPERQLETND